MDGWMDAREWSCHSTSYRGGWQAWACLDLGGREERFHRSYSFKGTPDRRVGGRRGSTGLTASRGLPTGCKGEDFGDMNGPWQQACGWPR
eukprot:352010-Chlamydomonas_euryale.AAC.2